MKKIDIVRAWKDAKYRASLTDAQRAELPEHPASTVELSDDALRSVGGAGGSTLPEGPLSNTSCCHMF